MSARNIIRAVAIGILIYLAWYEYHASTNYMRSRWQDRSAQIHHTERTAQ